MEIFKTVFCLYMNSLHYKYFLQKRKNILCWDVPFCSTYTLLNLEKHVLYQIRVFLTYHFD